MDQSRIPRTSLILTANTGAEEALFKALRQFRVGEERTSANSDIMMTGSDGMQLQGERTHRLLPNGNPHVHHLQHDSRLTFNTSSQNLITIPQTPIESCEQRARVTFYSERGRQSSQNSIRNMNFILCLIPLFLLLVLADAYRLRHLEDSADNDDVLTQVVKTRRHRRPASELVSVKMWFSSTKLRLILVIR